VNPNPSYPVTKLIRHVLNHPIPPARLPEAIQSHTRALLGADKLQTPGILLKLATLHETLDEISKSVTYHQKILALGEKNGMSVSEMAGSYIAVAEWEISKEASGDLALAGRYLEKVGETNAPVRDKAEGMLRELRIKEGRAAAGI
jgi:anaphase-promoting complex subunit 8